MKIGGLDVGTTGCKLTVFDEKGGNLGKAYRSYPVKRNLSGHEIDAKVLLECVFEVVSEAAKTHPDLSGIGVTSFGETFVLTDESLTNGWDVAASKPCSQALSLIRTKKAGSSYADQSPHPSSRRS